MFANEKFSQNFMSVTEMKDKFRTLGALPDLLWSMYV